MEEKQDYERDLSVSPDGDAALLPDDLLDELDTALEGLECGFMSDDSPETIVFSSEVGDFNQGLSMDPGVRQMQETFLEISRNTLRPVTRYMKALAQGENSRELLELTEFVVTPMIARVESVGLDEHTEDLTFFRSLLLLALGEKDPKCSAAMTEVVMEGFGKLSARFDLNYRGYRLAVKNLLEFYQSMRAVEGVSQTDVRKFFAIGVPSLTWVRRTKVSELMSLSGIENGPMTQIRKLAYEYRAKPRAMASAQRAAMPKAVPIEEEETEEFEEAVDFDSPDLQPMRQTFGQA